MFFSFHPAHDNQVLLKFKAIKTFFFLFFKGSLQFIFLNNKGTTLYLSLALAVNIEHVFISFASDQMYLNNDAVFLSYSFSLSQSLDFEVESQIDLVINSKLCEYYYFFILFLYHD